MSKSTGEKKRLRSNNSTFSDLDSSLNTSLNTTVDEKSKKEKITNKKKKLKMADTMETEENISVSAKIEEMNKKLNNILTKDDTSFIKKIISDTIEEMKDKILSSVINRIEKVEGDNHEIAVENTKLKKQLEKQNKEIAKLKEKVDTDLVKTNKQINALEQYGRRNNVRITGLNNDKEGETAFETIDKVLKVVNKDLKMPVGPQDIDIAHRIGPFDSHKTRPIIVKFVRRQDRINVLRNAKMLKGTPISINEDLTSTNAKVLASLRLKDKANIAKAWSFEGKLFAKYHNDTVKQIKYEEFEKWISIDWPKE